MTAENGISCPTCGATMNHHADKLLQSQESADSAGEVFEQLYRCPACGAGDSRLGSMGGTA